MVAYSAVAVFSEDLERVVLIHKLRPAWQAGKANFPGGKVEDKDMPNAWYSLDGDDAEAFIEGYRRCAVRELQEETGLVIAAVDLKLFCTLRFRDPVTSDAAEVQFYCCRGDVEAARTMESETVFVETVANVFSGLVERPIVNVKRVIGRRIYTDNLPSKKGATPTMSNLPWLTAMARQTLQGSKAPPFVVYEAGATS